MDTELTLHTVAILVLILANGFFALSEFSIIASRKSRLQQKIAQGKRGARRAAQLRSKPDRFLATIQVGITLVGTLAGVFGGATLVGPLEQTLAGLPIRPVAEASGPLSVAIVTLLITVTTVVLGELMPKYVALSNPERWARLVAPPIGLFTRMTGFFSAMLSGLANLAMRLIGIRSTGQETAVSEDEINLMIFEGRQKGIFDAEEEKLIKSVFDFADSMVRRAMTPRPDVTAIPITATAEEVIDTVIQTGFSRFPVYDGNIDNVVGVLYTRDLVHQKLNPRLIVLRDLIRKPAFVPDSMPLSKLLRLFQRRKNEFAVVLDEFGGTAGIVTLEDVLEELVGEIQDEDDTESPLVKHSGTIAFADGAVWPGAVNELMNSHLPEDKADSLAGMIIDHLGRVPSRKETVTVADMKITILRKEATRLERLKLERLEAPPTDQSR